jgi:hypothetical protein
METGIGKQCSWLLNRTPDHKVWEGMLDSLVLHEVMCRVFGEFGRASIGCVIVGRFTTLEVGTCLLF